LGSRYSWSCRSGGQAAKPQLKSRSHREGVSALAEASQQSCVGVLCHQRKGEDLRVAEPMQLNLQEGECSQGPHNW